MPTSFRFPHQITVFLSSLSVHATCPKYLILLDLVNSIIAYLVSNKLEI